MADSSNKKSKATRINAGAKNNIAKPNVKISKAQPAKKKPTSAIGNKVSALKSSSEKKSKNKVATPTYVKPKKAASKAASSTKDERTSTKTTPSMRRASESTSSKVRKAARSPRNASKSAGTKRAGIAKKTTKTFSTKSHKTSATQRAFLKYANDHVAVRWLYEITTGPYRALVYGLAILFVLASIYMPVRDFYIAQRTVQILTEQKAIRDAYNEATGDEARKYLSQEGIEDAARKDLNMVMPGEQTIDVKGLDEDGNPIVVEEGKDGSQDGSQSDESASEQSDLSSNKSKGTLKGADAADKSKSGSDLQQYDTSKTPTTSAEVKAAEQAVFENSAWYWKILDALFFFDGINGMAEVSTGE